MDLLPLFEILMYRREVVCSGSVSRGPPPFESLFSLWWRHSPLYRRSARNLRDETDSWPTGIEGRAEHRLELRAAASLDWELSRPFEERSSHLHPAPGFEYSRRGLMAGRMIEGPFSDFPSSADLYPDVWPHLRNIRNLRRHPQVLWRCGSATLNQRPSQRAKGVG